MSDKTDQNVSILKYMYGISSFRFFRFSMSMYEPSGFCLINICEMHSPVSCSHFVITSFGKSFWISKSIADSPFEEYRSYVLLVGHPKVQVSNSTLFAVSLYH